MFDKNCMVELPDRNNLIGSAMINEKSNIVLADEIVYLFLGASYSIAFCDYIHPDCRDDFMQHIKDCTDEPVTFTIKLKHYKGEYYDATIVMKNKYIAESKYINIEISCIEFMMQNFTDYLIGDKMISGYISMSNEKYFRYYVGTGQIHVYSGQNGTLYKGSMELFRATEIEQGSIADDSMQQFRQMCDAIEAANGDGFFKLNTTFCNEAGDNTHRQTVVRFATIEFNSQVVYVSGFISASGRISSHLGYESVRADLDPLTGMLNKGAIKKYAMEALERAKETGILVTLVMIDLDNFKTINDTFGHMFGDTTLVNVARIITDAVGDRGAAGRVGGDEFFIVLEGFENDDHAIRPLLRSIRSHIEWYFKQRISNVKVTCTVGTATYPIDANNYDDLFKLADHCLYVGKALGRNRFIIYTADRLGSIDDILNSDTVIQMSNYTTEEEKNEKVRAMIHRFNLCTSDKELGEALDLSMQEIMDCYDVDGVQYIGADGSSIQKTNYEINEPFKPLELYDTYKDRMDELGYISIGNFENSKNTLPSLVEYMRSNKVFSIFISEYRTLEGELKGMFVYSAHNRYQVWSALDTRMLLTISKIMEIAIK